VSPFYAQGIEQRHNIRRQIFYPIGGAGSILATMAAQIGSEYPVSVGEVVELSSPTVECKALRVRQSQNWRMVGPIKPIVVIDAIDGNLRHTFQSF
jgi:hypothetical protein